MGMYKAEFDKVFGGVNVSFDRSKTDRPMRVGKTARDKANGHNPNRKNIRVWESDARGKNGKWVKVG